MTARKNFFEEKKEKRREYNEKTAKSEDILAQLKVKNDRILLKLIKNDHMKMTLIKKEKKNLKINDSLENNERKALIRDWKYQTIMEKEDYYKKRLETEKLKLELQKQMKL